MKPSDGSATKTDYRIPLLLVGVYLIGGAIYTFSTNKWFAGFPPVLDVLNLLPYGRYIEGAVAALLGVALLVLEVLVTRRMRSQPPM